MIPPKTPQKFDENGQPVSGNQLTLRAPSGGAPSMWDGHHAHDKSLVIIGLESFGDTLMGARVLTWVKQRVGTLYLVGPGELSGIIDRLPVLDGYIPYDQPIVPVDYYLFMMEALQSLNIEISTAPYLRADSALEAAWAAKLPKRDPRILRVGLNWGGAAFRPQDHYRSISIQDLAPVIETPNCEFYSLRIGENTLQDADELPNPVIDFTPQIRDFDDTASLIANLDVIITTDTALVHLAGALGVQTWLMLPFDRLDWRWRFDEITYPSYPSFWYYNMQIFVQDVQGNWPFVINNICEALRIYANDPQSVSPAQTAARKIRQYRLN
ncbi:MAG: hypothetical protein AAF352_06005 [Pseudomonadota bacterium]